MRTTKIQSLSLIELFRHQTIATMPEMKKALGTSADATVFRKLRELPHHTSYSHRGRYYTLGEIADFDEMGLWSFGSVRFSKHGTLISTAKAYVETSNSGYFADELENLLHVGVQDALRKLFVQGRISRDKLLGRYLYCSSDSSVQRRQLGFRTIQQVKPDLITPFDPGIRILPDELKAAIVLFFSLLDEKQRRLYAGLESLKLGHGGDRKIAELLRLDVATVAKGRRQLLVQYVEIDRVRKAGGGRPSVEKKHRKSSNGSES